MFLENMMIVYPLLLLTSTSKSFEAMGKIVGKTGKTISRWMRSASENFDLMEKIALFEFKNKTTLYLIFDDTLIRKMHSRWMTGSGRFFDTQIGRRIMAYRLLVAMISDGNMLLPIKATYLFPKELLPEKGDAKLDWLKKIILAVQLMFPNAKIIVTADGAFSGVNYLTWFVANKIPAEVRFKSNCVVAYKGIKIAVRDIKEIVPNGRKMARTITVIWHGLSLELTAQRRINKYGKESVVYQAATFKAKPIKHVQIYKIRWKIEKSFRTTKQHLGLQSCFSTTLDTQLNHVSSVLLVYAFVQLECKKRKLPSPESTIRTFKLKNDNSLSHGFNRLNQIFHDAHV